MSVYLPGHRHADHVRFSKNGKLERIPQAALGVAGSKRHHSRFGSNSGLAARGAVSGDNSGARGPVTMLVTRIRVVILEIEPMSRVGWAPIPHVTRQIRMI